MHLVPFMLLFHTTYRCPFSDANWLASDSRGFNVADSRISSRSRFLNLAVTEVLNHCVSYTSFFKRSSPLSVTLILGGLFE